MSLFASVLSLGEIAACGGGQAASSSTPARPAAAAEDTSCPAAVPGTSVTVEDTDTGAALVFVTTGDVAELRSRVAGMAKMHNEHHAAMGAMPSGAEAGDSQEGHDTSGRDMGDMEGHDMSGHDMGNMAGDDMSGHDMGNMAGHDMSKMGSGGMIGVHSSAEADDIDGGAKLVLTVAPADVAKLQRELRMHAQHMSAGTCAMGHH